MGPGGKGNEKKAMEIGRDRRTAVRKEIVLLLLVLLWVAAVPQSTSRYQTLYEGILILNDSLIIPQLPLYVHILPPGSKTALLDYWKAGGAATNPQGRLIPPALDRILVYCTEEVPSETVKDPETFSEWMKEKCEFAPLWRP